MKPYRLTVQNCHRQNYIADQSGYTLIELIISLAIIGILAATAVVSYQTHVRKTQVMTIYNEINYFRLPYQLLIDEGTGDTDFSPSGLNMSVQTKYCQFSVNTPNLGTSTPNAIVCHVQNLNYLTSQTVSLNLNADGSWSCQASSGINREYLPEACK